MVLDVFYLQHVRGQSGKLAPLRCLATLLRLVSYYLSQYLGTKCPSQTAINLGRLYLTYFTGPQVQRLPLGRVDWVSPKGLFVYFIEQFTSRGYFDEVQLPFHAKMTMKLFFCHQFNPVDLWKLFFR
jgi:hypothetical protein